MATRLLAGLGIPPGVGGHASLRLPNLFWSTKNETLPSVSLVQQRH